jgi:carbamoyl-phosphate synthase large subunit
LIAYDKLKTHSFLSDLNIPVPLTTKSYSIAYEFLKEQRLSFPLVVKPRFGFGSANTFIARNNLELEVFYNYAPDMIIQQFIDAEAVNIDGLGDLMSNPISIVPWKKLLSKMGETERCVTIDSPEIIRLGEQLIKSVGIIGPFDADIFRDTDGRLWVLELNLRFGGGYPVSQLAGADFPSKIIRMIRGENLESCMGAYKRGVTKMKKLEVISGPTPDCLRTPNQLCSALRKSGIVSGKNGLIATHKGILGSVSGWPQSIISVMQLFLKLVLVVEENLVFYRNEQNL